MPWVRLHGVKDYLDMVMILEKYPLINQTFNLVPALLEQIEDYINNDVKDKFLEISAKAVSDLTRREKEFILENFFRINKQTVISAHPRYYELYFKKEAKKEFSQQDYLDLQVWFNLSWIDPYFRDSIIELKKLVQKARFFTEEDKRIVLAMQIEILKDIIPAYKKFIRTKQIEVTVSPYYHPILPLLCDIQAAKEANPNVCLPDFSFIYPQDAEAQINQAVEFYRSRFEAYPLGMWPSEEAVSEEILPFIIKSGINWIVTDEAVLFKSLENEKRNTKLLYQPHLLRRKKGDLTVVFRDRNLSDLIGFNYHKWDAKSAVDDFIKHLENIASVFKDEDILVSVAMDGENAWEYYPNDGRDFLELLYARISEEKFIKTTTISNYLERHPAKHEIGYLTAGSWISADFSKWIGNPYKNKAWEYLTKAREELQRQIEEGERGGFFLAKKQIYIIEGSDWFWWYGDDMRDFDKLFRMHLSNFYILIGKEIPEYLKTPLSL